MGEPIGLVGEYRLSLWILRSGSCCSGAAIPEPELVGRAVPRKGGKRHSVTVALGIGMCPRLPGITRLSSGPGYEQPSEVMPPRALHAAPSGSALTGGRT